MKKYRYRVWLLRIVEGVTIGLVVAFILVGRDRLSDYNDRQEEIEYIRDLIVSYRSSIADAQALEVYVLGKGPEHRTKEQMQKVEWDKFIARLSDVLANRTSHLIFDEKRDLRYAFPGISVDGRVLLGDSLDSILIGNMVRISYDDIFGQVNKRLEWLELPPLDKESAE